MTKVPYFFFKELYAKRSALKFECFNGCYLKICAKFKIEENQY